MPRAGYNPSALPGPVRAIPPTPGVTGEYTPAANTRSGVSLASLEPRLQYVCRQGIWIRRQRGGPTPEPFARPHMRAVAASRPTLSRSAEHTSELQSLMRISYAVFCLQKTRTPTQTE